MVWGCVSWHGVGNLALIHGIITVDKYVDILTENLEESTLKMNLDEEWMLQQNNDPKHIVKKTKPFLQNCKIEVLEWLPQSTDLNPIENLWSLLDTEIPLEKRHNKTVFKRIAIKISTN
ncbi:Transposable element Tcb1 transposase [Anthophora quadrimaculata]